MISDVLAVHILFGEVAALVLEYLTVHGQYLREQAYFDLFVKLIDGVTINKNTLLGSVGVQIQKAEELPQFVVVHDDLPDCVDGGVQFGRGIDIAPVEVDAVGVDPVVSPRHSVGVENREDVKDELVPQQSRPGVVLS